MALQQQTIRYRTYIKETIVEALRNTFFSHPDDFFHNTNITVDLPLKRAEFPAIIVRFYERYLRSAGVGHAEWFQVGSTDQWQRFKHFYYGGDIELVAIALTSKDRDWLADAIVQIVGMSDTESYSESFLNRVYNPNSITDPTSTSHFINLKTEDFSGFGDQDGPAPWMPEDVLTYRTSYRIPIFGEFYSRELTDNTSYGKVTKVELYPWIKDIEVEPTPDPQDPSPWIKGSEAYSGHLETSEGLPPSIYLTPDP